MFDRDVLQRPKVQNHYICCADVMFPFEKLISRFHTNISLTLNWQLFREKNPRFFKPSWGSQLFVVDFISTFPKCNACSPSQKKNSPKKSCLTQFIIYPAGPGFEPHQVWDFVKIFPLYFLPMCFPFSSVF